MRCNEPLQSHLFSHYLKESDIQKVEMSNVNGKFVLNEKQLKNFRKELLSTSTEPNLRIKTGSMAIIVTKTDGESYVVRGSSRSDFLEVSADIATQNTDELKNIEWLVLNTNGINFHNYKKR